MAITRVTNVKGEVTTGTSASASLTVTGSNTFLIAQVANQTNNTTGVTCNGVSMIQIQSGVSGGSNRFMSLWYLINPSSGNIVATRSSGTNRISVLGILYSGVNQSSQPDASSSNSGTSGTITGTVTTVANNCWAIFSVSSINNATASTNSTFIDSSAADSYIFDTQTLGNITPPGSFSMSVTQTSATYGYIMASFSPVPPINNGNMFLVL